MPPYFNLWDKLLNQLLYICMKKKLQSIALYKIFIKYYIKNINGKYKHYIFINLKKRKNHLMLFEIKYINEKNAY